MRRSTWILCTGRSGTPMSWVRSYRCVRHGYVPMCSSWVHSYVFVMGAFLCIRHGFIDVFVMGTVLCIRHGYGPTYSSWVQSYIFVMGTFLRIRHGYMNSKKKTNTKLVCRADSSGRNRR